MIVDVEEVVLGLLKSANPEGEAHRRLSKMLEHIKNRVMIGPASMRYLQRLLDKHNPVECKHLSSSGRCRIHTSCQHQKNWYGCPQYEPPRINQRVDPLASVRRSG